MFRSVETFLRPRTIAIVGASETGGGGWAKGLYANFDYEGFPAKVYLINPGRDELWGQTVYPNFASLPEPIDLAIFIIPAEAIPDAVAEAADAGLRNALIFASRFGEGGDVSGSARADALRNITLHSGLRISGPNCMGAISLPERLLFYPTARVRGLPRGSVGIIFQSGGTFQFWLEQGAARGLGYSYAISSGNELDLDMADYLNFLIEDENTKVIACMAEGVRRPHALMAAAQRALDAGKPVLMLKVGRTLAGQEAAQSHTGALATDENIFKAMCHKYGIVLVETLDELIETSLAFSSGRLPEGNRAALVGYSGGAKGLFIDIAEKIGLELPEFTTGTQHKLRGLIDSGVPVSNPLDTGAGLARRFEDFAYVCKIVAEDPNIDMISVQGQLPMVEGAAGEPGLFRQIWDHTAKPVIAHNRMSQNINDVGRAFQEIARVPFLQRLPEVANTLKALAAHAERRRRGVPQTSPSAEVTDLNLSAGDILELRGIPRPDTGTARTTAEVGGVASRIGFPVAIKVLSKHAVHKTEVGGVKLDIVSADLAIAAAEQIQKNLWSAIPGAVIDGFQVQKMVSGLEMIIGIRDDTQFGPLLALGFGGVIVEAIRDVSFRLLPVFEIDVREMIEEVRARPLLGAYRGTPCRDVGALIRAVVGITEAYMTLKNRISDIEINPLIVGAEGEGVCAVDIRAIPREGP
ncbi:MAG: acetate--CoA ligase family protein [Pseudomonadota bacterium]|nr:acetate--CoA ligase family protein [Pseudomonadota bacterium]